MRRRSAYCPNSSATITRHSNFASSPGRNQRVIVGYFASSSSEGGALADIWHLAGQGVAGRTVVGLAAHACCAIIVRLAFHPRRTCTIKGNASVLRRPISHVCLAVAAATTVMGAAGPAQSQDYPTKPVTFITPAAAGNSPDVATRIVADRLGQIWKQQIIVLNRPGAGGLIAAQADRQSTRLNSSHLVNSYAVFCLKKKKTSECNEEIHHYKHKQSNNKNITL